jgi:predicted TIM-barrel fold metal-dependent hydrolase
VDRRTFLGAGAALAWAQDAPVPVIDTHIHLFDPTRAEGVPWPARDNAVVYRPALPARFRALTASLGVVGAIEIECSPWIEDNQWVLDVAARDTIIVGTVGNLEPGQPGFRSHLERFRRNALFRGIRCGYLWGRDLRAELTNPAFLEGLKMLADADLVLDTANPSVRLLEDAARITDRVPSLRVVLDHLPKFDAPGAALREFAARPRVFAKVSAVLRATGTSVPMLDRMWDTFGPDRLIYGSDWPNSDPVGPYAEGLRVVREYFHGKGRAATEKVFWRNSLAAYRWVKREAGQPKGTAP